MKYTAALLTLCLIMGTMTQLVPNTEIVRVLRADILNSAPGTPLMGSLQGGANLAIKGTGFDDVNCKNEVLVGNVSCNTAGWPCTSETILCQMPPSPIERTGMAIFVKVQGVGNDTCNSSLCLFSYSRQVTPLLIDISRKAVIVGDQLGIYGYHKISNPGNESFKGEVGRINIGDFECPRGGIMDALLDPTNIGKVSCVIPPHYEAGFYNVSEMTIAGWAEKSSHLLNTAFNTSGAAFKYNVMVQPTISNVDVHTGSRGGKLISITGTGFSKDWSNTVIKAAGTPCQVKNIEGNTITCLTDQSAVGASDGKILNSSATTQVNPYYAGSGATFTRYNISTLVDKTTAGLRAAITGSTAVSINSGTTLMLEDWQDVPNIATVVKGYLKVPKTGTFKLMARANSKLSLYVNTNYGTGTVTYTTPTLEIDSTVNPTASMATSLNITNVEHYFYFELYHIPGDMSGFFTVQAEMSSDVPDTLGTYEVQTVKMNATTHTPETMVFVQEGGKAGDMVFIQERVDSTGRPIYYKRASAPYNADATQFKTLLEQFDTFGPYEISVTTVVKDASNATVASSDSTAFKWIHTVTIHKFRAPDVVALPFNYTKMTLTNPDNTITPRIYNDSALRQSHSPILNGTFSLSLAGVPIRIYDPVSNMNTTNIPIEVDINVLRNAMATAWNCPTLQIEHPDLDHENTVIFIVSWDGCPGTKDLISTAGSAITGGMISVSKSTSASTGITFDPITSYLLRKPAAASQINLMINGIPGVCTGDCSYAAVDPQLSITAFTLDSGTMQLRVQTTESMGTPTVVANADIIVWMGDYMATVNTGIYTDFTTTGVANIPTGVYYPRVMFGARGFGVVSNTATNVTFNMIIDTALPANQPQTGGNVLTISGHGYPPNMDAQNFSVIYCGLSAQLVSVSTTSIDIVTPPCNLTSTAVQVVWGATTQTTATNITIDTVTGLSVTSIAPSSISPIGYGNIVITGTGFDADLTLHRAFLTTGANNYRVTELTKVTSTTTSATFKFKGDVPPGNYSVVFYNNGLASSNSNVTLRVETYVTAVTNESSPYGGSVITFTGVNFDGPLSAYKVIVKSGDLIAEDYKKPGNCTVTAKTATTLTCTMGLSVGGLARPDFAFQAYVIMNEELLATPRCTGGCNITYTLAKTLQTNITSNVRAVAGTTYAISGLNFRDAANPSVVPQLFIGSTQVTLIYSNSTFLNFTWPNLISGSYPTYIKGPFNSGRSNTWTTVYPLTINNISVVNGSRNGAITCFKGVGLRSYDVPNVVVDVMGPTVVKTKNYNFSSDSSQLCVQFIATSPGTAKNNTFVVSYNYNGVVFELLYTALYESLLTLARPTGASVEEGYQATITTLDFEVTTTLNITGITPTHIAYYAVGTTDVPAVSAITNLPVTWDSATSTISIAQSDFDTIRGSSYCFHAYFPGIGYTTCSRFKVTPPLIGALTIPAQVDTSYLGGATYTISGTGLPAYGTLQIGSVKAELTSSNPATDSYTYTLPAYPVMIGPNFINASEPHFMKPSRVTADNLLAKDLFNDGQGTSQYSSTNWNCFIAFDLEETHLITAVKFFIPYSVERPALAYFGAKIQGVAAADFAGATWIDIASIESNLVNGWNTLRFPQPQGPYNLIRFVHDLGATKQTSNCRIGEFQAYGLMSALPAPTSGTQSDFAPTASLYFSDELSYSLTNTIHYMTAKTATVSGVSPKVGAWNVANNLIITGVGFGTVIGDVQVKIDNIICVVSAVIDTQIDCSISAQANEIADTPSIMTVTVLGNKAVFDCAGFKLASPWSHPLTWGASGANLPPPMLGANIVIPAGKRVWVDVPNIHAGVITINGTLIIDQPSAAMNIRADTIIINGGALIIGNPDVHDTPLAHPINIELDGIRTPGKTTKAIICNSCNLQIHGNPRLTKWLKSTNADAGANTLPVPDTLDWVVGDQIVVGPSFHNYEQFESHIISAFGTPAGGFKDLTTTANLNSPRPVSVPTTSITNYQEGSDLAVTTRSINIVGIADPNDPRFGPRIIVNGPISDHNKRVVLKDFALKECGQALTMHGCCIRFNSNGDLSGSIVQGTVISNTFNRMLTISGGSYLNVNKNVGYNIAGHGIVLETGAEMDNMVTDNLVIRTKSNPEVGGSDMMPSGIYITNPHNVISGNVASGSDHAGISYSLTGTSTGLSYDRNICPEGIPLLVSLNNVAHSNKQMGVHITNFAPRRNPCAPPKNNSLLDPWSVNPGTTAIFQGYTVFANPVGVTADIIGAVKFLNCLFADNNITSMAFDKASLTPNSIEVQGSSFLIANIDTDPYMHQIVHPPTDNIKGIKFTTTKHANSVVGRTYLDLTDSIGPIILDGLTYDGPPPSGQQYAIIWDRLRCNVIYDMTGAFINLMDTGSRTTSVLTFSHPHIVASTVCPLFAWGTSARGWDDTSICGDGVSARTITISKVVPATIRMNTQGASLKIYQIATITEDLTALSNAATGLTTINDQGGKWSAPFLVGKIYAVWWDHQVDFRNLSLTTTGINEPTHDAIILRFNYTEVKELLQVAKVIQDKMQMPLIAPSGAALNPATCNFGEYHHDTVNKFISVCVSDKQRTVNEVRINALDCHFLCNDTTNNVTKQNFIRLWSNTTQWSGNVVPAAGSNVTIPASWTLILDQDPNPLTSLIIEGNVLVDDRDTVIMVGFMWVKGSFSAGNSSSPFTNKLTIYVNGTANSTLWNLIPGVDPANKLIAVTGNMTLYSDTTVVPYSVVKSKVTAAASTTFDVDATNTLGWVLDDQIYLTPSFTNPTHYDPVTVSTQVSGVITPKAGGLPTYTHYGNTNSDTGIDMRSQALHVTRKIKIVSGVNTDSYGFRVLVMGTPTRNGAVTFRGVQFVEGGQQANKSALQFWNTPNSQIPSTVELSSFVKCSGNCIRLVNNANVTINNNVFVEGRKWIVYAESQKDYVFTNNVMTGALFPVGVVMNGSTPPEEVACYFQPWAPDYLAGNTNIVNMNRCYGSQLEGFVLPLSPCDKISSTSSGFGMNLAAVTQIGFMLNGQPNQTCQGISNLYAFNNKIGIMTNPPDTQYLQLDSVALSDNQLAISLKQGFGRPNSGNITTVVSNSWIAAASRAGCNYCYGVNAINCTGNKGIRYGSTTSKGRTTNDTFGSDLDFIDSPSVLDSKLFVKNVVFQNFKDTQTSNLITCSATKVFEINPKAVDSLGSINLLGSTCTNCQLPKSLVTFPLIPADAACGETNCTGLANYYIRDDSLAFQSDGAYFYIPRNSTFAAVEGCVLNTDIQGYLCHRDDLAVLQFQSISKDFDKRTVWPVSLSYDTSKWTTIVNAPKKWDTFNRMARFSSLLVSGQMYQMTFSGQPPGDMRLQLQKKTDSGVNSSDYVVLNITYKIANVALRVSINELKMDPILTSDTSAATADFFTTCGANKYYQQNGTLSVVITGGAGCDVRVKLVSSIIASTTISTDLSSFEANGGVNNFRSSVAKFLNVSQERVIVTSVKNGSTIIDYYIIESVSSTVDNSINENTDPTQVMAELDTLAQIIQNSATSMDTNGLGNVIGSSTAVNVINADGTTYSIAQVAKDNVGMIVGIVVGVLGAIGLGIGIYFIVKKKCVNNPAQTLPDSSFHTSNQAITVEAEKVQPNSLQSKQDTLRQV